MTGRCGLCRGVRELRDSHLLPASVYKLSRSENRKNPHPVVTTRNGVLISARQVSDHFLCVECEDRFSKNGERYVVGQCSRPRSFKLRQLLEESEAAAVRERFSVYSPSVLGAHVSEYLYFAASVFWRAAARTWRFDNQTTGITLGSQHQEAFRRYLLGEAQFPEHARLFMHVWSDKDADFTTVFPCSNRTDGKWRHKFCIPGILFILFVGKESASEADYGALNSSDNPLVWLCPWEDDSLFRGFARLVTSAPVKSPELS